MPTTPNPSTSLGNYMGMEAKADAMKFAANLPDHITANKQDFRILNPNNFATAEPLTMEADAKRFAARLPDDDKRAR